MWVRRHPEGSGDGGSLPDEVADVMVENCVGVLGLPLAVAPYFMVDHRYVYLYVSLSRSLYIVGLIE